MMSPGTFEKELLASIPEHFGWPLKGKTAKYISTVIYNNINFTAQDTGHGCKIQFLDILEKILGKI